MILLYVYGTNGTNIQVQYYYNIVNFFCYSRSTDIILFVFIFIRPDRIFTSIYYLVRLKCVTYGVRIGVVGAADGAQGDRAFFLLFSRFSRLPRLFFFYTGTGGRHKLMPENVDLNRF